MINDDAVFMVSFEESGVRHTFEKTYEDACGVTWKELLHDFLRFLDGSFGYDISSKVSFEAKDWAQLDLFKDDSYGGTE